VTIDNSSGAHSHPGRVYVIWDESNIIRIARSDDSVSWPISVPSTPPLSQYDLGGDVKVGADGTVYAIWNRLIYTGAQAQQSDELTYLSKSIDGGVTWSAPASIASHRLLSFGDNSDQLAQDDRGVNAFASLS